MNDLLCLLLALTAALPLVSPVSAATAEEETIVTVWPLVDYRHDPQSGYARWGFLGPLVHLSSGPEQTQTAIRPLYYSRQTVHPEQGDTDILYPLYTERSTTTDRRHNFFQLYQHHADTNEGSDWTLFPFLFFSRDDEGEPDFAVFPLGGTIHRRFGKDRIRFTLFPLYGQTLTDGTEVTNVLWPFFATLEGPETTGFKAWPLYGFSEKTDSFRKDYWLWPFFYHYQERLDGASPRERRGFFPLYMTDRSPEIQRTYALWPFFSWTRDNERGIVERWAPWPLHRSVKGEGYEVRRYLPLYADEVEPGYRKRWWLWPLFKQTENTRGRYRSRFRVLFFLYSDLRQGASPEDLRKERVALWPLFTWERIDGRERFFCLSLLEPFFPDNASIDRSWGPLWRLYQSQTLPDGTRVRSLLWNLYWQASREEDSMWELFPLVQSKNRVRQDLREVKVLKGLFGYRRQGARRELTLFFLPFSWDMSDSTGDIES